MWFKGNYKSVYFTLTCWYVLDSNREEFVEKNPLWDVKVTLRSLSWKLSDYIDMPYVNNFEWSVINLSNKTSEAEINLLTIVL